MAMPLTSAGKDETPSQLPSADPGASFPGSPVEAPPIRASRYGDFEPIGEGASAKVYRATDRELGSVVVIKVLRPHLQTDDVSLERFQREIQIARHVGHRGVVAVYDLVREPGATYLVMEYVPGRDLKTFLRLESPVAVGTAVSILTEVLETLAACHARDVVHRDLKPQNIMINPDGVKLLDFGIAKLGGLAELTQTSVSLGSPEYMAPELFARHLHDPRTDLYAVGVAAFELLAGRLPFQGDSVAALCEQHVRAPVPSLAELRAEVPAYLRQVVERLLAKRPHERYQSAEEVLADLAQRRVAIAGSGAVAKRVCLSCNDDTPAELTVCLQCGAREAEGGAGGEFDVLCEAEVDEARLRSFGQRIVGERLRLPQRGRPRPGRPRPARRLLFTGVSRPTAEALERSARREGLPVTIARRSPWAELRKGLALAILAFLGRAIFDALEVFTVYPALHVMHLLTLFQIALCGVLGWICARRAAAIESEPLLSLMGRLKESPHDGWLTLLQPSLTRERSEALRACVSHLVESSLQLEKHGRAGSLEAREELRKIIVGAAEVAQEAAAVEKALAAPRFVREMHAYATLGASRNPSGEDEASAATRAEAAAILREYYALEERFETVSNGLIRLQALFNRLLGRALVAGRAGSEEPGAILGEWVTRLRIDLDVARQVRAELERLA